MMMESRIFNSTQSVDKDQYSVVNNQYCHKNK